VARMINTEVERSKELQKLGLLVQDYSKVMVEIEIPTSQVCKEMKEISALKMTSYDYYAKEKKLYIRDPKKENENQKAPNILEDTLSPEDNAKKAFSGIKND